MSAAYAPLPSQVGVRWRCELCGADCHASKAHQSGCLHYRVLSAAWKDRAMALHAAEAIPKPAAPLLPVRKPSDIVGRLGQQEWVL